MPVSGDLIPVDMNGVIAEDTSAQVQAMFSGSTITPSQAFSFPWNGVILSFIAGDSVPVAPDLLAALTAAGAPFSQP